MLDEVVDQVAQGNYVTPYCKDDYINILNWNTTFFFKLVYQLESQLT